MINIKIIKVTLNSKRKKTIVESIHRIYLCCHDNKLENDPVHVHITYMISNHFR